MRRIIMFALVALTMFGGVAMADRRDHRGGVHVQQSRPRFERHYNNGPRYERNHRYTSPRYVTRPSYRYVRRPIYVQRPVIRYRYYNYYQRPAVLVENYAAMPGYYWVAGAWSWNGYEWIWTPGHYEPDPNYQTYDQPTYDPSYDYDGYSTY